MTATAATTLQLPPHYRGLSGDLTQPLQPQWTFCEQLIQFTVSAFTFCISAWTVCISSMLLPCKDRGIIYLQKWDISVSLFRFLDFQCHRQVQKLSLQQFLKGPGQTLHFIKTCFFVQMSFSKKQQQQQQQQEENSNIKKGVFCPLMVNLAC